MKRAKASWEFGLLALLPAALLGFAVWTFCGTYAFVKNASRAMGFVVALEPHIAHARGGVSSVSYYPRIRYQTQSGRPIEFTSRARSRNAEPGSTVEVLYNAANPLDVRLNQFAGLWEPSVLLFAFAGFFIAFPLSVWYLYERARKQKLRYDFDGPL